jgi:hypothetical protein
MRALSIGEGNNVREIVESAWALKGIFLTCANSKN